MTLEDSGNYIHSFICNHITLHQGHATDKDHFIRYALTHPPQTHILSHLYRRSASLSLALYRLSNTQKLAVWCPVFHVDIHYSAGICRFFPAIKSWRPHLQCLCAHNVLRTSIQKEHVAHRHISYTNYMCIARMHVCLYTNISHTVESLERVLDIGNDSRMKVWAKERQ